MTKLLAGTCLGCKVRLLVPIPVASALGAYLLPLNSLVGAGALLSHFLADPIYLSSVTVGVDGAVWGVQDGLLVEEALRRAIYGRLLPVADDFPPPFRLAIVSPLSVHSVYIFTYSRLKSCVYSHVFIESLCRPATSGNLLWIPRYQLAGLYTMTPLYDALPSPPDG